MIDGVAVVETSSPLSTSSQVARRRRAGDELLGELFGVSHGESEAFAAVEIGVFADEAAGVQAVDHRRVDEGCPEAVFSARWVA